MSDLIIDQPSIIFGGYVQNASMGVGYGADSGSCQLSLVYENDGPLRGTFDPEVNFPALGTAVGFKFGECTFGGIFQRYTNKRSTSGYIWDIIIESPGKWLDGIQIILDGFQGNRYVTNYGVLNDTLKNSDNYQHTGIINTQSNGVFTNQLNNIWNPFACREYYGYKSNDGNVGVFGGSNINSAGFPAIDALELIQSISQGKEAFGGKAVFGDSEYEVDLTEVIDLLKTNFQYFRVKGPVQSLSSIIQECCEIALHDYVVFIEPKNGIITSNGIIQDPVIKVKVIDKSKPPDANTIKNFINKYEKSNQLISGDFGKEFNDSVTQRLVIGGPASRYNFVDGSFCYPIWGKFDFYGGGMPVGANIIYDEARSSAVKTGYTYGTGLNYNDNAPIVLKTSNTIYNATVLEVRCAMHSFETWMLYKLLKDQSFPGFSNIRLDSVALQKIQSGNATINEILNSAISQVSFFSGMYAGQNIFQTLQQLHTEIKQAGEEFYGRKFLVPLPIESQYLPNNIKWVTEDQSYITSWQIAESAWTEILAFSDVSFYDSDGKTKASASWDINSNYDYSALSNSYAYNQLIGAIGTNEINVSNDIIFYGGTPYGLAAFAMVDMPPVSYFDSITTDNYGLFHLLKLIKNINAHPNIMQCFGNQNGSLHYGIAPSRVAPMQIGIPQESSRYSWGPWWWASSKKGKAEVLIETELRPETFGSSAVADYVGFSYAYMANANVGGNESGYVELPEVPAYNLASRFAGTGPYITNIDINIASDGIKTTYKFNTWTPQFGKLAKYNSDRISRINKNYIKFLQDQRSKIANPPLPGFNPPPPAITGANMRALMFGLHAMNAMMGQLIRGDDDKVRSNVHVGDLNASIASVPDKLSEVAICSQEQFMTPIQVDKNPTTTFTSNPSSVNLSAFEGPTQATEGNGNFTKDHFGPTSRDLDPYFAFGENDFQIVNCNKPHLNMQDYNPDSVKVLGLRGPLILSGWGFSLDNLPVPSIGDEGNQRYGFHPDVAVDRSTWKTGPVNLLWDDERKVWSGGPQFIEGILIEDITAPSLITSPTEFDIYIYKTKNWESVGERITCTNRDPSLKVTNKPGKILVIAMRINYEWRPIWIGCPDTIS